MDEKLLREAASALLQAIGSEGLEESDAADRYQELSGPDDILVLLDELQALRAQVNDLEAHNADLQERLVASERSLYEIEDNVGISAQTRGQLRERAEHAEIEVEALRARVTKLEWQVDQCQRFAAGFRDIEAHDDPRGPSQARPCCVHFLECCASDIEGVVGKFGDEPCVP